MPLGVFTILWSISSPGTRSAALEQVSNFSWE